MTKDNRAMLDQGGGYCLYGLDGACLIHSQSAGVYNLYANPLNRQYDYMRQSNDEAESYYQNLMDLRDSGLISKSQLWKISLLALAIGALVTLLGVIS